MKKLIKYFIMISIIVVVCSIALNGCNTGGHTHDYLDEWKTNDTSHWRACSGCSEHKDEAEHTFSWITDSNATTESEGSKHEECDICGYKKTAVTVPKISVVATVINHLQAQKEDLTALSREDIAAIKSDLRIAYFHTSHGNQIIEGNYAINYLFGNDRSMDFSDVIVYDSYGRNLYVDAGQKDSAINDAGTDIGDLVAVTKAFLGDGGSPGDLLYNEGVGLDVNVIIWSWCGELSFFSEERVQQYLDDLNELENYYNGINAQKIVFVYQTGHLYKDYYTSREDDSKEVCVRNNAIIRDYCIENGKILFDFEDIESYNPDGVYYGDRCDDAALYWEGHVAENWAWQWESTHTENVDWVALNTLRNSNPAQNFSGFKPLTTTNFSHVEYSILVLSKAYAFWGLLNSLVQII